MPTFDAHVISCLQSTCLFSLFQPLRSIQVMKIYGSKNIRAMWIDGRKIMENL